MSLRFKIVILAILPLLTATATVAMLLVRQAHRLRDEQVELIETSLMNAKRGELTHAVTSLENQLLALIASERDVAVAQQRAKELIRSAHYGADGYFFAHDRTGVVLVHPRKPELEGKNLWDFRDPSGKYVHRELHRVARAGGGFVHYYWEKPSSHESSEKLGYVRQLAAWDWTFGGGLYLDDVKRATETVRQQSAAAVSRTMWQLALAASLALGLVFGGTMLLTVLEQRLADAKLRSLNRELVCLNRRINRVREDERARVSSELHDGISQQLAGTKYHFELARQRLAGPEGPATTNLDRGLARLTECIQDVRRISHELRPRELDELGLAAALRRLTDDVAERSGLEVSFQHDDGAIDVSARQSVTLFRIAQEAMTNVERHAGARKVELELARDECRVRLRVTDDGCGFDPQIIDRPELDGLGLRSIRQRVEEQTGTFRLRSRPGFTELAIDFGHGRPA